MKYSEIKDYFSSDEKLIKLLEVLTPMFNQIDQYSIDFIADAFGTFDELRVAKTKLTGIVASLNPIYSQALSMKKQEEYRFYSRTKKDVENKPAEPDEKGKLIKPKFVDGATQIEAKDYVRIHRNLRDLLCGYIKSAESLIYDLKDRIEKWSVEYENTKNS